MARDVHAISRIIVVVSTALALAPWARATDKASIPWKEFNQRSTFVFRGLLTRAELVGNPGEIGTVRCTYKIYDTYKGEPTKEVTFDAPLHEQINTEVGRLAIVALRREQNAWVLSVDGRSCWKHQNRMKKDFGGFPVYDIPTGLIRDVPAELSEMVELLSLFGDEYRARVTKVFPTMTVEHQLRTALGRKD